MLAMATSRRETHAWHPRVWPKTRVHNYATALRLETSTERRPAGMAVATVCEREVVGVLVIYAAAVSSH